MRTIAPEEKILLNKILEFKNSGDYKNLHFSNIISKELDSLAILIYNTDKKKVISLYSKMKIDSDNDWDNYISKFNKILDFIYLIEDLERYSYIKLQENTWEKTPELITSLLYDRNKYEYSNSEFHSKKSGEKLNHISNPKSRVLNNYAELLDKYVNKIIYPTPLLIDFVKYKYKSIDERRFQKQLCRTDLSVIIAAVAAIAAIASTLYNIFCDSNPSREDMQNIESAILQKKIITIDSIAKYHTDTINVNITNKQQIQPIDLKVTVTPNQVTH